MYSGFNCAATGLKTQSRALETSANNAANSGTTGYKKDTLITKTFGDYLVVDNGMALGSMNFGNKADGIYTSFEQGSVANTGRALDFCLQGNGFFNILMKDGTTALSRNGQFEIDKNGFMVNANGDMVLGNNGPIKLSSADFNADEKGNIYINGYYYDSLLITAPLDIDSITKNDKGYFKNTSNRNTAFTGVVIQGAKEISNVDVVKEMVDMMANSKGFQSCSQIIKMYDQIMQKAANELGRL